MGRGPNSGSSARIQHLNRETAEVRVEGDHREAVLEGDRRELRVRDQVPGDLRVAQDFAQERCGAESRRWNPR